MGKRPPKKGFNQPLQQLVSLSVPTRVGPVPSSTAPLAAKAPVVADEDDATLFARAMSGLLPQRGGSAPAPTPATVVAAADEAELFAQAMAGVAPLRAGTDRLQAPRRRPVVRHVAQPLALARLHDRVAGPGEFVVNAAVESLEGRAPGVSLQLLETLRRGRIAYSRRLDLHGLVQEAAYEALVAFMVRARQHSERCVLVITGRGQSSPGGVAVLRQALPQWLTQTTLRPHVLAYATARPADGGRGAFYVLLRRAGVTS